MDFKGTVVLQLDNVYDTTVPYSRKPNKCINRLKSKILTNQDKKNIPSLANQSRVEVRAECRGESRKHWGRGRHSCRRGRCDCCRLERCDGGYRGRGSWKPHQRRQDRTTCCRRPRAPKTWETRVVTRRETRKGSGGQAEAERGVRRSARVSQA